MSWRNIRGHKLRSVLTTLGVVIGVGAVIAFVTLGASLQAEIITTLAGDNTDAIYVSATSGSEGGLPSLRQSGQAVFTTRDVDQMRRLRGVEAAVPVSGFPTMAVVHGQNAVGGQWVTVTSPSYFPTKGDEFVAGRPFRSGEREVVLNQPAARMFGSNVTVGDEVTLVKRTRTRVNATVVGITNATKADSDPLTGAQRPAIYAPPRPFYNRTVTSPTGGSEQRIYPRVIVDVNDAGETEAVQGRIYSYLTGRSDARALKSANYRFEVTTYQQLVDEIEQVSDTFTAYISGIAVISLIVGAIGIANIMLVSVTERTREIGIMKAVGAKRGDIVQLFLLEAVLLGLFGSVFGAGVGLASGYAATRAIDLPFRVRPIWFGVSVVVGVLVGVGAGLYPAWRAAVTDPIDALRRE